MIWKCAWDKPWTPPSLPPWKSVNGSLVSLICCRTILKTMTKGKNRFHGVKHGLHAPVSVSVSISVNMSVSIFKPLLCLSADVTVNARISSGQKLIFYNNWCIHGTAHSITLLIKFSNSSRDSQDMASPSLEPNAITSYDSTRYGKESRHVSFSVFFFSLMETDMEMDTEMELGSLWTVTLILTETDIDTELGAWSPCLMCLDCPPLVAPDCCCCQSPKVLILNWSPSVSVCIDYVINGRCNMYNWHQPVFLSSWNVLSPFPSTHWGILPCIRDLQQ